MELGTAQPQLVIAILFYDLYGTMSPYPPRFIIVIVIVILVLTIYRSLLARKHLRTKFFHSCKVTMTLGLDSTEKLHLFRISTQLQANFKKKWALMKEQMFP